MHQSVALFVFIFLVTLSQSSPAWAHAIPDEAEKQGVNELLQSIADPTANKDLNKITSDKTLVGEESEYSCFPWIFNPGKS